jgi:uncharacterized protein (DUF488 family)
MTDTLSPPGGVLVLTIGHSTRPLSEFTAILRGHGVETLADVRSVPRSRHNPQFNRDTLPEELEAAGVAYACLPDLGGFRHARRDSINTGWRNAAFRGFADYMQTAEFCAAIDQLMELALGSRVAIMCAEAVPWRCHRSLIADALLARGAQVEHILGPDRRQPHRFPPFVRVDGIRVTYPAPPA